MQHQRRPKDLKGKGGGEKGEVGKDLNCFLSLAEVVNDSQEANITDNVDSQKGSQCR